MYNYFTYYYAIAKLYFIYRGPLIHQKKKKWFQMKITWVKPITKASFFQFLFLSTKTYIFTRAIVFQFKTSYFQLYQFLFCNAQLYTKKKAKIFCFFVIFCFVGGYYCFSMVQLCSKTTDMCKMSCCSICMCTRKTSTTR